MGPVVLSGHLILLFFYAWHIAVSRNLKNLAAQHGPMVCHIETTLLRLTILTPGLISKTRKLRLAVG